MVFNGLNNLFAYLDCVARIYNQQKSIKNHSHSYYSSNFYRFSVLLLCETLLRRWNLTIIVIFIAEKNVVFSFANYVLNCVISTVSDI